MPTWNDKCKHCKHTRGEHGRRSFNGYKYSNACLNTVRYATCACLQFNEGDNNEVIDRVYENRRDCSSARVAPATN